MYYLLRGTTKGNDPSIPVGSSEFYQSDTVLVEVNIDFRREDFIGTISEDTITTGSIGVIRPVVV